MWNPRRRFPAQSVPLHRIVWAVGALLAMLSAATALTAFTGLHASASATSALQVREALRTQLDTSQRDIATGELHVNELLATSAPAPTALAQARQERRDAIGDWALFKAALSQDGVTLPGLSSVDADLNTLRNADTAPAATGDADAPTTAALLAAATARTTAQAQLDRDFGVVRDALNAWLLSHAHLQRAALHTALTRLALATGAALLIGAVVIGFAARSAGRRDRTLTQRDHDLHKIAASNEVEARLQRALEMATGEEQVYGLVEQCFGENLPELRTEMLLADSSRAHFERKLSTGRELEHHCDVESPDHCPAAQRGQIMSFDSSTALDACSYLRRASPEPCAAVCLPVSVSGTTFGVVHAVTPVSAPPSAQERATLELVARRASERIGMLRAFNRSELQAATDPLTGLSNRRSLEAAAHRLASEGIPYAVAFADLDHFKRLNDTHGHGAGDRALRMFATVMRDNVRPGDLIGRYGGEEFILVLPNCPTEQALGVLERLREQLALVIATTGSPAFTVSIGLAELDSAGDFRDRVATADVALLQAKTLGRDRIVVADSEHPGPLAA